MTTRRSFLGGGLAATLSLSAPLHAADVVPAERFPLWPKAAPGADRVRVADEWVRRSPTGDADDIAWPHVATPMLSVARPERPNRCRMHSGRCA